MNELESVRQLIARFEWMEIALRGTPENPGLIERLDRLFGSEEHEGGQNASVPLLISRLEKLTNQTQELLVAVASVQDATMSPEENGFQQRLEGCVSRALENGTSGFDERAQGFQRLATRVGEQLSQAMAQAEMLTKSAEEATSSARTELERAVRQVSTQLEDMLKEVSDALSADYIKDPLKQAVLDVLRQTVNEHEVSKLKEMYANELNKLSKKIQEEIRQYQMGIEESLSETMQESSERIKRILSGRAPSEAIIELYDKVELLEAENLAIKKGSNRETGEVMGIPASPLADGMKVACLSAFGAMLGAALVVFSYFYFIA